MQINKQRGQSESFEDLESKRKVVVGRFGAKSWLLQMVIKNRNQNIRRIFLASWLCFAASIAGLAQVSTATLSGVVTDPIGGLIPQATVTAKNPATGQERTAKTGLDGSYTLIALPPGTYRVIVEAQGFAPSTVEGLDLSVGTTVKLDFAPKVPVFSGETVTVTAESGVVDTLGSNFSNNFTQTQLQNLPLLGGLFSLQTPEARSAGSFDPTKIRVGNIAIYESNGRQNNFTFDGIENYDFQKGGTALNIPLESVQEIQLSGPFSAENRRAGLDNFNVISKSGTNEFHGGVFLNFGNDRLEAKGPFGGPIKPSFDRQELGGSLGGRIRRDRAFFFIALKHFRENGATSAGLRAATLRQIVPSFSRTSSRETLSSAIIDFTATTKNSIRGRYSLQKKNSFEPGTSQGGRLQDQSDFESQRNDSHQIVLNWTHIFSSAAFNSLQLNLLFSKNGTVPQTIEPQVVFPTINVGTNFLADQSSIQRHYQLKDDLPWKRGNHTLSFGADYNHISLPQPNNFNLFGISEPREIEDSISSRPIFYAQFLHLFSQGRHWPQDSARSFTYSSRSAQ